MRESSDPYAGPNGTLLNKLGITDADKLKQFEQDASHIRMAQLKENPIAGKFDREHLQAIHKHIFQDVYSWAGEPRTVRIAKGPSEFAHPDYLKSESDKLFSKLAQENHLKGQFASQDIDRVAHYFTEVNALHNFREGNGRAQQAFFEQLGREAGKPLDFSKIDKDQMVLAAVKAHNLGAEHFKPVVEAAFREGQRLQDRGFGR